MNHSKSESQRTVSGLLLGAALGAAAMYIFDPDRGRRRRALARDKVRGVIGNAAHLLDMAARDIKYRVRGLTVQATRPFRRKDIPDDLVLIERVRARMGRVVSHPHAIQIGALAGRVTLSGPILASEVGPFLDAVRSVMGVCEIEDHLVIHERPDSIPGLQGGARRPEMRSEAMRENWSPAVRVAAIVGGGLLTLYGMRHRTLAGLALGGIGLGLTARGASNVTMTRLAELARGEHGTEPPDDATRPRSQERPALH
jgi:hypothetical protein